MLLRLAFGIVCEVENFVGEVWKKFSKKVTNYILENKIKKKDKNMFYSHRENMHRYKYTTYTVLFLGINTKKVS